MSANGIFQAGEAVAVLTTQPLGGTLDYAAPEGGVAEGAFVVVPLGPRRVMGVVWGPGEGGFDRSRLRRVAEVLDVAPMGAGMREFLTRAGAYTLTDMHQMLRMATRAPGLTTPPGLRKVYRPGAGEVDRMTPARERVLGVLEEHGGLSFTLGELAEIAGVSTGVVKGLVKLGAVSEELAPRDVPYPALDPGYGGKALNEEQAVAAAALRAGVASRDYGTTLLKGVTGSGKTEVYLEAVAECLAQGRQALVLLPEIALTQEFLARVEARFGARPAEWHHGVTVTERRRCWKMVGEGGAQLVVGARSALFLPFRELGLIVIDEEHDGSYKQEDGVTYSARDMGVLRASIEGAQVVLASATPSLESWANAEAGKYARVELASRFGAAVLPQMRAIDMRTEGLPGDRWVSPTLQGLVRDRMEKGEQALLFLNRRGYAPVTICRACGHQVACPDCDARMVEHRFLRRLMCHQCGHTEPVPETCPSCDVEGKLAPVGPGVERLAEEVTALFPQARVAVLSSDLFGSARALKVAVEGIAAGAADIVIGTQMVAKGHNFPLLTLVGVIDADLGLQGSDLRAAEKTFQLMRQVAGRAGRAEAPGLAVLQSYQPEHPVIRAILSGEEEAFWRAEAEERKAAGVPPYGRLVGIVLSSPELEDVNALGMAMARRAEPLRAIGAQVFGPAPAPIARIRGRHRVRLLVKAGKAAPVQGAVTAWLAQFDWPARVRVQVDVDPLSFF
ncbi:primosomal protein N' [Vannielia litorea]|uniref:Replication restart protein PriA n=1 Tax=Vannielia litorea TaxID=1217970 RepID=A0A1N6EF20_9RHOB|nr:primosomal protein N' [Vannielia litorea]SIN81606.1 replication restart DNA helicase PriA [Vannielia litorea]